MGTSVDVTSSNFAADVVEASFQKPVLVDFFAQWCGPCQMLKPLLEKMAKEYDFVLAKVDIDRNPDLASTYHIEGVPDVRIVMQGQMYQGFTGAMPETQLRQFLAQLNLKSDLETGLEKLQQAEAAGETEQIKALYHDLLTRYPQERRLAIAAAKFWIDQGELDTADQLLQPIREDDRQNFAHASALRELIRFKKTSDNPVLDNEFDKLFVEATNLTLQGNYETALQQFLEVVSRNRQYRDDAARKAMVTIFNLLGDDHPLTRHYRKQLMLTLY
jgi:putative thioredoxin